MVAGIECRTEEEDAGDSANYLSEVVGFVLVKRAAKQLLFACSCPCRRKGVGRTRPNGCYHRQAALTTPF